MERPLLLLSDTHLSRQYGESVGDSLALVIRAYPDCEIVLAGDIFDLSLDEASVPLSQSLAEALAPHEKTVDALSAHVARGQKVTLIPGNHDAGLQGDDQVRQLRSQLQAADDRTVEVASWFIRRGRVHIEHGHLYDHDCANNHPLALPNPRSEGLGTALMRRFVAPNDALFFAHANQTTISSGLRTAFDRWGTKAPRVIVNYFKTAANLCLEARSQAALVAQERAFGNSCLHAQASKYQLPESALRELLKIAPLPTHHSLRATLLRLYFDRLLAITALAAGLGALSTAGLGLAAGASLMSTSGVLSGVGTLLASVGGGYLGVSTALQKNRYGNKVIGQLDRAAEQVRIATDSSLVIFGHTHVEVDRPGYLNLGSFGYGRPSRPYALVSRDEKVERRRFTPDAA
jgi:UDP-2,3-diacylglucosamine pyrophosphatase LpxH